MEVVVVELCEYFGLIIIFVNNVGIIGFKKFEDIIDEDWDIQFIVNIKGIFIVMQIVLFDMKVVKWGWIVNILFLSV